MRAPTPQQLYNRTVEHLHTQGKQASDGGVCLYRRRRMMCAVGCHIPDELYEKSMEGTPLQTLLVGHPDLKAIIIGRDPTGTRTYLLRDLQSAHDEDSNWDWAARRTKKKLIKNMVDNLRVIARNHGVSAQILTTLGY